MMIVTKHGGNIRDLERLIKKPVKGIRVERVKTEGNTNTYDVHCKNLLDLAHECKQLSDATCTIIPGGKR